MSSKQWQGAKQLSETLSLNKIQNRAGDMAQWSSAPEFNPWHHPSKKRKEMRVFTQIKKNLIRAQPSDRLSEQDPFSPWCS